MGDAPIDAKNELLELDDPVAFDGEKATTPPKSLQRPTVIPKFDPRQYAEESEIRGRMPTITDEDALELARLQSCPTNVPPPRGLVPMEPEPMLPSPADSPMDAEADDFGFGVRATEDDAATLAKRLAPLSRVPTLAREMSALGKLLEDPKTAYVLGFVDGVLPLETIVDVTGLPELDTLRVLDRMIAQGAIVFKPASR